MRCFDQLTLYVGVDLIAIVPHEHAKDQNQVGNFFLANVSFLTFLYLLRFAWPLIGRRGSWTWPRWLLCLPIIFAWPKKRTIYGVVGRFDVPNKGQIYLTVISRKVRVGDIQGHTVWRMESVDVIGIKNRSEESPEDQLVKNVIVTSLVNPYFYFSYSGDLTQNATETFCPRRGGQGQAIVTPLWPSFSFGITLPCLNSRHWRMRKPVLNSFLIPMIHGAVFINKCMINGKGFTWSLISRRSRHRCGARLYVRGCDQAGKVRTDWL